MKRICGFTATLLFVMAMMPSNVYGSDIPDGITSNSPSQISDFVTSTTSPINLGYVFCDGKYIESPYVYVQKNTDLYINGTRIESWGWMIRTERPDMPPVIPIMNNNMSRYDKPVRDYLDQAMFYYNKHLPSEKAVNKMKEIYKTLPFVKSVEVDSNDTNTIIVHYANGDTHNIGLLPIKGRPMNNDRESVIARLNRFRLHDENSVRGGACIMYSTGGRIVLSGKSAKTELPAIRQKLRSSSNYEQKMNLLNKSGLPMGTVENIKKFEDSLENAQLNSKLK